MRYVDLGKTVEAHQQRKVSLEEIRVAKKKGKKPIALIVLFVVIALVLIFGKNVGALFNPVSIVSNIASPNLKETDGRTNILLLGLDRRSVGTETSVLTDTLLFASVGRVEGNVAMISLPRDLWVEANAGKGPHFLKINSVYAVDGMEELVKITEDVLGTPIHYYGIVDFNLFKDAINILGGIEVNVENSFIDYQYPVEGKEADSCGRSQAQIDAMADSPLHVIFPCRYETVEFEAGLQTMDGETALKYVRSRKGTNNEGTDFARSKRQQNVIMAIKKKILSLETIVDIAKVKDLYDLYVDNVDTNITFSDIQGFYLLSQQIEFDRVRSIVLDDRSGADEGGLLYHPTDSSLYGGAYVLVPKVGNYSQIRAYVQRYIFGE